MNYILEIYPLFMHTILQWRVIRLEKLSENILFNLAKIIKETFTAKQLVLDNLIIFDFLLVNLGSVCAIANH